MSRKRDDWDEIVPFFGLPEDQIPEWARQRLREIEAEAARADPEWFKQEQQEPRRRRNPLASVEMVSSLPHENEDRAAGTRSYLQAVKAIAPEKLESERRALKHALTLQQIAAGLLRPDSPMDQRLRLLYTGKAERDPIPPTGPEPLHDKNRPGYDPALQLEEQADREWEAYKRRQEARRAKQGYTRKGRPEWNPATFHALAFYRLTDRTLEDITHRLQDLGLTPRRFSRQRVWQMIREAVDLLGIPPERQQ